MNTKNTWLLLLAALLLGGFIFGWEKFVAGPARQPRLVLPGLKREAINTVQLRVAGQPEIVAERTNGGWRLVQPLTLPAHARNIELLLAALAQITPAAVITPRELMEHKDADAEFGFDNPQVTLVLTSRTGRQQIIIGAHTAPGDQVFLEVVGVPGVSLVTTNLLNYIPPTPADWRNTELLDWENLVFDRLQITQGPRTVELQRNATNDQWRLIRLQARADSRRVNELLQQLQALQITQFVSDAPGVDLDAYGLLTPELEMAFAASTNINATLQFGRSPTNHTDLIYARRAGSDSVFTVSREAIEPWRGAATDFRDRHLVAFTTTPPVIEVVGEDRFTLERGGDQRWRVRPQGYLADTNAVADFLQTLTRMEVAQFVKDVVIESALTNYGLATPARQYLLKPEAQATNGAMLQLSFGARQDDLVYARRADEESVYAVKLADFNRLPAASWELRDRRIWHFTEEDVARVLIEQAGRKRKLIRNGTNSWSLAQGSFGAINTFAVEETVHRAGDLQAAFWTARGPVDRAKFGFSDPPFRLTFTLQDGTTRVVEFGGEAPSQFPYALVTLDGEPWVCEFPWATWQYILTYLSIPVREL